jgi:hypothetical protein
MTASGAIFGGTDVDDSLPKSRIAASNGCQTWKLASELLSQFVEGIDYLTLEALNISSLS